MKVNDPINFYPYDAPGPFSSISGSRQDSYLDLNEQLIKNKNSSFLLRVNCKAMEDAGIHPGDMVIADSSLIAKNGKVVIAKINGAIIIRFYALDHQSEWLVPATKMLSPLKIDAGIDFRIMGVVTYVIHHF